MIAIMLFVYLKKQGGTTEIEKVKCKRACLLVFVFENSFCISFFICFIVRIYKGLWFANVVS